MQIALTQKGQAALWVTNGWTSMSKPITTWSTPIGVDNNEVEHGSSARTADKPLAQGYGSEL